jgi:hypothetical protein
MIPQYLLRLGQESALVGQRFDRFEIEREAEGPRVNFRVSSRRANELPWQREVARR